MKKKFLAGMRNAEFLQRHWQKAPLFARAALQEYTAIVTRDRLMALAQRDDVESRLVTRERKRWIVRQGPFKPREFAQLPQRGWTLLVQGVDLVVRQAARLMREFAFIPYARFDDVMVSYAAPGGGVGPHVDSYDVFLLQGQGRRRWQISRQRDLELVPDAPLELLKRFEPQHEWVLEPGDVLYLPPQWAHDGVALEACITYSVGFRAPRAQEIEERFLDFLRDRIDLDDMYEDRGISPTRTPALIPNGMIDHSVATFASLKWRESDVTEFLGTYLSEPKPHVTFARPPRKLTFREFERRAKKHGVKLALATRMLYRGRTIFINGEACASGGHALGVLKKLANRRELVPPLRVDARGGALLYAWYSAGYIEVC